MSGHIADGADGAIALAYDMPSAEQRDEREPWEGDEEADAFGDPWDGMVVNRCDGGPVSLQGVVTTAPFRSTAVEVLCQRPARPVDSFALRVAGETSAERAATQAHLSSDSHGQAAGTGANGNHAGAPPDRGRSPARFDDVDVDALVGSAGAVG